MRIWFDTEFIEDGKTIDLISIGMIAENGSSLYMESAECKYDAACPWVRSNVFPYLTGIQHSREEIAEAIRQFVLDTGEKPEFWAYYCSYDWVALCQLFGRMSELPAGWPMFCRDLQYEIINNPGFVKPEHTGNVHNALDDAIWTKYTHLELESWRNHAAKS